MILEIERSQTPDLASTHHEPFFDSSAVKSIEEYLSTVAAGVRTLTGYDRTLIYKFDEDWNGVVAAESKEASLVPWLGLHFPASDIPKQAREIFLLNWIRTIADVNYIASPIIAKPGDQPAKPLDLSKSLLRAVSPIHLEYLRNMEVAASMTISIICNGRLWGLIACHHGTPKYVNPSLRFLCALLAKTVSYQISLLEQNHLKKAERRICSLVAELEKTLAQIPVFESAVENVIKTIKELIPSDGTVIFQESKMHSEGRVPETEQLIKLHGWLKTNVADHFATSNLAASYEGAEEITVTASGLLAIRVNSGFITWCRGELVREVAWAGDPDKAASQESPGGALHPRKSFAEWKTLKKGTSTGWATAEIAAAQVLRETFERKSKGNSGAMPVLGQAAQQYTEKLLRTIRDEKRQPNKLGGTTDQSKPSKWDQILGRGQTENDNT